MNLAIFAIVMIVCGIFNYGVSFAYMQGGRMRSKWYTRETRIDALSIAFAGPVASLGLLRCLKYGWKLR